MTNANPMNGSQNAGLPHFLLLIAQVCLTAGAVGAPPAPPPDVEVGRNLVIGKGGDRGLHAVAAWPKNPNRSPMPAVLWFHGGGWARGDYAANPLVWLAQKGYFTATIEYRLSAEAKWPAQIEDCKLAVRWLRANAARFSVDPNRIGCWGSSAGGHLVACLGTMADQPQFEGDGGYPGTSSAVQAVVDFCGPTDMTEGSEGILGHWKDDAQIAVDLFGGTFKQRPEAWRAGSPITYVHAGEPPFIIVHGDADTSVPPDQSERFAAALERAGVPVQLILVKGGTHTFPPHEAPGKPPAEPDAAAIKAAVLAFLDRNLKP